MSESFGYNSEDTRLVAERLLAAALGGAVRLDVGEALEEREYVSRFALLDGPAGAPASVIAKRARLRDGARYDPEATDPQAPSVLLFNDWAGLQLLSQAAGAARIAPRFYGGDRAAGLFLMEDFGAGDSPDQALLGDDPAAAEASLIELATVLGRMHAATIGRQAELMQLRTALGPYKPAEQDYAWLAKGFYDTAGALDIPLRPGVAEDIDTLMAALRAPGPFLAYTHGDPCPDNWLRVAGQLRLFDFERGAFRHALLDGVYGRIHFPTCWCVNRMPAVIPLRMEAAYRAELVGACPEARDDALFEQAVVDACAYWVLRLCSRNYGTIMELLEEDREWGISTVRQRVLLRIGIFERLTAEAGHLAALGATLADMAAQLRARWPAEADAMPVYPAFRA